LTGRGVLSPADIYTLPIAANSNPRIFFSAGEASGDAYGAAIVTALRERIPGVVLTGLGGVQMEAAGLNRIVHAEDIAVMGVTEILLHIPLIVSHYRKLVKSIRRQKPDVAVLIDFPDVNFRLAKRLNRAGVPVVWFVSPQLWAWKRRRLRWVQERVSKMLVIFPFEERFYRERGVDAQFVGHPLAEAPPPRITREEYAAKLGLDPTKTWIALLPGSRWKELHANLPALHELAMGDLLNAAFANASFENGNFTPPANLAAHTQFEFILPVASTIKVEDLRSYLDELNRDHLKYFGPEAAGVRITLDDGPDAAREALMHARASVVASGTATVQAALLGNPFIVVYRVSNLTYQLVRHLVRYPEEFADMRAPNGAVPISMVNLIAQRRLVPELLQDDFTAAGVAAALYLLLAEGPAREAQIAGLKNIRQNLRGGKPSEQVIYPTPAPFTVRRRASILRVTDAVISFLSPDQQAQAQEAEAQKIEAQRVEALRAEAQKARVDPKQ
jgi:lipid-A-disaccharide synthase